MLGWLLLAIIVSLSEGFRLIHYNPLDSFGVKGKPDDSIQNTVVPSTTHNPYSLVEEFYSSADFTWLNLFTSPPGNNSRSRSYVPNAYLPQVDAWRALDKGEDDNFCTPISPPPSLEHFLNQRCRLDEKHTEEADKLWQLLRKRLKYLSEDDQELVKNALTIAYIGLWGKHTLRSLEVFVNRAVGIAGVLGELNAEVNVILAGILHEVVCGSATGVGDVSEGISNDQSGQSHEVLQQLLARFSPEVVQLSQQYCRLPRFMARRTEYSDQQAEIQVQMLVASAEDYLTLYLRLADRLHTMRVLRQLPHLQDADRVKIAQEALYVYAPLAHKMGVMKVKSELEDLAFKTLDPEMFLRARYTQTAANKAYQEAAEEMKKIVADDLVVSFYHASLRLTHRIKGKYELLRKMQRKGLADTKDVRDALGLRLIADVRRRKHDSADSVHRRGIHLCYYLVDRLKNLPGWEPLEGGFKDYIKEPKENGYQSLHQYIRHAALGSNVEVQVRTRQMHMNAELGDAAHWYYKDLLYRNELARDRRYKLAWRSPDQLAAKSSAELLGLAHKQLLAQRVFVYLEDSSTVLSLKKGSTCLDAAFAIHTNVGLSTTAIRINDEEVKQWDRPLRMGDVVSVQRHPTGAVQATPSWLPLLRSSSAQAAVRRHLREYEWGLLVCSGLVQLLAAFSWNSVLLRERYAGALPTAHQLSKLSQSRLGLTLPDFLAQLGTVADGGDLIKLVAGLVDIPRGQLQGCGGTPMQVALMWAHMQGRKSSLGWEDAEMLQSVLLPMLREVLPEAEAKAAEAVNCQGKAEYSTATTPNTTVVGNDHHYHQHHQSLQNIEAVWVQLVGPSSLISAPPMRSSAQQAAELDRLLQLQKADPVIASPTIPAGTPSALATAATARAVNAPDAAPTFIGEINNYSRAKEPSPRAQGSRQEGRSGVLSRHVTQWLRNSPRATNRNSTAGALPPLPPQKKNALARKPSTARLPQSFIDACLNPSVSAPRTRSPKHSY